MNQQAQKEVLQVGGRMGLALMVIVMLAAGRSCEG